MSEQDAVPVYIHIEHVDERHTIEPETLFALTTAYEDILGLFDGKAAIQIGVTRKGSWEVALWIVGFIGIGPLFTLFTGKSADEWAKLSREAIVTFINQLLTTAVTELPEETPSDFYRKRNRLYEQLEADGTVASVKLGETSTIQRPDFPLYIAELADEEPEYLGEFELLVSSPDWKGKRSWRGRIVGDGEKMQSFSFNKVLTRRFWQRVHQNNLIIKTTEDILKVQPDRSPHFPLSFRFS